MACGENFRFLNRVDQNTESKRIRMTRYQFCIMSRFTNEIVLNKVSRGEPIFRLGRRRQFDAGIPCGHLASRTDGRTNGSQHYALVRRAGEGFKSRLLQTDPRDALHHAVRVVHKDGRRLCRRVHGGRRPSAATHANVQTPLVRFAVDLSYQWSLCINH